MKVARCKVQGARCKVQVARCMVQRIVNRIPCNLHHVTDNKQPVPSPTKIHPDIIIGFF
jgi:hypothetical protein